MKIITYAGIALVGAMFTSTTFAGCGKQSRFNFPAMSLRDKAHSMHWATAPRRPTPRRRDAATSSGCGWPRSAPAGRWRSRDSRPIPRTGEFLNDNGSPIEGSVCFGIWSPEGRSIKIHHPAWNYDSSGNLIGTVVIKEQITVDAGGNAYQGTVSVEAFDLSNHSLGIVFQGTVSARRITG